MNLRRKVKLKSLLSWTLFLAVLTFGIWFFINRGAAYIDRDIAGDFIGGKMMFESEDVE